MKNSFFLVIPKLQSNPVRLKEFEEKAMQNWINELPPANPGLATRLIHDFLADFKSLEMPAQLRLSALEMLRPSVIEIEDNLRSRLMNTGFPKDENEKKIHNVLVTIERYNTIGYWMVLKELTERDAGWFQGKNVALAIQRCIKGLSSLIISNFIMGMAVPDWVWIDLHSLYRLSVKTKKDTTKVANDDGQSHKASTPEECYRQILLLSLVDPTGLMQKEVTLVYKFIETIDTFVTLKSEPAADQLIQCIIQTDEDKPPFFDRQAGNKDSSRLYLDFSKLHNAMMNKQKLSCTSEARFSSVQIPKNDSAKLTLELVDYLEQRWSGVELQGAAQFADRLDRYVAIGLESTYDLLVSQTIPASKDIEFLMQSASDRSLACNFSKTGVLSVGSLVSFRKTDVFEHRRSLGIVSKVVVEKQSGNISIGLQLLARQSWPVTYTQTDVVDIQKGLFYGIKEASGEKGCLLTDKFFLKNDDTIRMTLKNEELTIILGNRKNVGLGYWQFECRRFTENVKAATPTKKGYDFI